MDLFEYSLEKTRKKNAPLASRIRPESIEDFFGQEHVLAKGKPLYRMIQSDKVPSMIFYGPPGTGKTTLAMIISKKTNRVFEKLSAVTSGVKDIRAVTKAAEDNLKFYNKETILFIDEIHRFNKSQQDALLPFVENGTVVLIGATTENPYFEVNKALVSRCLIVELHRLSDENIIKMLKKAIENPKGLGHFNISISEDSLKILAQISGGDGRNALNTLEIAVLSSEEQQGKILIDEEVIRNSVIRPTVSYDKNSDEHYDTISAFIKSMRGSDPDAAVLYLTKMIIAGEDPKFIARRMVIFASEDIGNADPNALNIAVSVFKACEVIGLPECKLNLAQGVLYLATAPKSNASYLAIIKAEEKIGQGGKMTIPSYLRDAHFSGAADLGRGSNYLYPHDYGGYVKQQYLPDEFKNEKFYKPKEIGYEKEILESMKLLIQREDKKNVD